MNEEKEVKFVYIPPESLGLTEEEEEMKVFAGKVSSERRKWEHFTPEFVNTQIQSANFDEMIDHLNKATQIYADAKLSQKEGIVLIRTKHPIGVVHLGDLHIGSIYSNLNEILRKFEVVKNTPNLYVVLMSNLIDNAIPSQFPSNMLVNSLPPDKQVILMRKLTEELNAMGKVLAAVTSPCHEGWTWKHTGQDINALLFGFPERKFPVLQNGGILHLKVGDELYKGALFHQVGPFESNFNEVHALKQLHRLSLQMSMDWLAGAHRHIAEADTVYEGNGDDRRVVAYIRTGSEKGTGSVHDDWTVGRYGRTGEPTGQVLHLFPDSHRIQTTLDFDDAVSSHEAFYLKSLVG